MDTQTATLAQKYRELKEAQPKLRIRDAAGELGVSEAELVALGTGDTAVRLQPEFRDLLLEMHKLGPVMALTRNDDAVHERHGVYNNISFQGPVGLAVNPDIDLRLFMQHWAFAFAVNENNRKSIQIFDKSGEAVHKIYCTDETNKEAYEALVSRFKAEEQDTAPVTTAYPAAPAETADERIDLGNFQKEWTAMKDSHEFFGLLKKYNVSRLQAMRLAPAGFTREVSNDTSRKMLGMAAERRVPIMVFVGNRGCIQIHSGEVSNLMEAGPWYNVLDSKFNLHLRETAIAHTYVVRKPSTDGDIHSIEAYDAKGEMIVQFFGARKPGIPELESWRAIVNEFINQAK